MRKLFLFALVAFAISCSKDAETDQPQTPDQPSEQPEKVTVSFAVKGDVTIEEDPLSVSRAAGVETESTDLYGINIYYDKDKDGVINDVYGYGLFDNVADMTVSLLTGYKYKFVCSLIKDGKSKIDTIFSSNGEPYCSPFTHSNQDFQENSYYYDYNYDYDYPTILENKFVLGTYYHLTGLGRGYGEYKNADSDPSFYSPADRYYGETTDYIPKEGGIVNISMKRCAFGAKFVVTGVTDGTFNFSIKDNNNHTAVSKSNITSDTTYEGEIFTYDNVYGCWKKVMEGQDFSQDFTLFMTWTRGNGVTQKLDPLTVTFKRNIMTTVNIRLNGGDTNNSFHLDVDNAEMGNENTDLDVDAGNMSDTPVNPTE